MVTGWACPGCGGLRAVNDLTHGQVAEAWHSNALFLTLLPMLVVGWAVWCARSWTGDRTHAVTWRRWAGPALMVAALAFAVWRNTPSGAAFRAS